MRDAYWTMRMNNKHHPGATRGLLQRVCLVTSVALASSAFALSDLHDEDLSDVSGAGLAFGLEDFRYQAAPTSYLEFVGGPISGTTTFRRGDVRYYGLTLSGFTGGNYWDGSSCTGNTAVAGDLSCSMSTSTIARLSPHDNPYVARVFDYSGVGYVSGDYINTTRTVFEFLGPSNMDSFRWGFWGELQVNKGGTCPTGGNTAYCGLQSQTLLWGKPTAPDNPGNIVADLKNGTAAQKAAGYEGSSLRLFQNVASADNTMGIAYDSRLSGDFRFSVNQQASGTEGQGNAPRFSLTEGLYFRNVAAHMPLGTLHYQSLVLDDVAANPGNFTIELTRLPNDIDAYRDFYSLSVADSYDAGYTRTGRPARYYETHGYSIWGRSGTVNNTGTTGATGTKTTDTTDGIYFYKGDSAGTFTASANRPVINAGGTPGANQSYSYAGLNNVNIGDASITGMLIQHLVITTCSAGSTSPC